MNTLSQLPNISNVIESKLILAGINTPEELRRIGSRDAFVRIKLIDPTACQSMLYALEGAVAGVRWHNLGEDEKAELKSFFSTL